MDQPEFEVVDGDALFVGGGTPGGATIVWRRPRVPAGGVFAIRIWYNIGVI